MAKHLLLTGGCGFIGHHVCEHILKNTDWQITIIDALRYAGDVGKVLDIEGFNKDRVKIFWHDLRAPIMDSLAKRIGNVDYIINMASESDVERSIREPKDFIQNNVLLSINMLEYARKVLPYKYIQISTDEVYGPAYLDPYKEWDRHVPSNPYSASKSAQEVISIAYWRTYNVPLVITVTMNNFGERQHPEKLVPKTIKSLVEGNIMPIHAHMEGEKWVPGKRTWLHARNHADALLYVLENVKPNFFPAYVYPTKFNIAGDKELANNEVFAKIAGIMGVTDWEKRYIYTDFHKSRPGHDHRYALDGSLLRKHGWKPPMDLDESFERTVKWTLLYKDKWL